MRTGFIARTFVFAGAIAALTAGRAGAVPITIAFAPQVTDIPCCSTDTFNTATMTFAAIYVNELVSIDDTVGEAAYVHSHAGLINWEMDIRLDGTWSVLLSGSVNDLVGYSFPGVYNTTFSTGSVDGIRFLRSAAPNNSFHGFDGASFTFDSTSSPVPEPASMLLLGTGLAAVGARLRRRQERR